MLNKQIKSQIAMVTTGKSEKPSLTIVVNTCDAYDDVLGIFFLALNEFWPDCPYPVVINTEKNKHTQYPARVQNYYNKSALDDWGDRLRATLNSINTEFVLMLYDDFILEATVDDCKIQEVIEILKADENAAVVYVINTSLPLNQTNDGSNFIKVKDKVEYRLNSAPGVWRKEKLFSYTEIGDTPWAWEVFGTYRTFEDNNIFYSLNPNLNDVYQYNYKKGGAIYRGKWVREVIADKVEKYKLDLDFNQRGFSSDTEYEKRSLYWKIKFMMTGYRMVGIKSLYFVLNYINKKFNAS